MMQRSEMQQAALVAVVVLAALPICGVIFTYTQASVQSVPLVHVAHLDVHASFGLGHDEGGDGDGDGDGVGEQVVGESRTRLAAPGSAAGGDGAQGAAWAAALVPDALRALAEARELVGRSMPASPAMGARGGGGAPATPRTSTATPRPAAAGPRHDSAPPDGGAPRAVEDAAAANPRRVLELADLEKSNEFRPVNPWFSKSG